MGLFVIFTIKNFSDRFMIYVPVIKFGFTGLSWQQRLLKEEGLADKKRDQNRKT